MKGGVGGNGEVKFSGEYDFAQWKIGQAQAYDVSCGKKMEREREKRERGLVKSQTKSE